MKKLFLLITLLTLHTGYTHSQWTKQTLPINKPISGIKFIDSLRGWACTSITTLGDTSFIINTTNGGATWSIQYTAPDIALYALSIIDVNTGYCGGSSGPGRLFKTTNGGLNWNEIGTPTRVMDMFFVNKDSGWISNETFAADVRTTTDGGASWQLRNSGLTDNINRLFFLNYSTGYCGSRYFKKTTNAGLNWVQIYDFVISEIYSLFFINEQTGWVGMENEKIRFTSNGGINWILHTFPPLFGNLTDISYFSNKVFFGNRTLRLLLTTNSGAEWVYQIDSSASYRLSFIDSLRGWSGDFGIAKTTNGGGPIIYLGIINVNNNVPNTYKLYQNYPNPFNSQTNIRFSLTKKSLVHFKIYDILGREKTMWQSERDLSPGTHELQFDAKDLASGVYFYQLVISDNNGITRYKETRKMILLK
ncbi:MAG: T9SS type A sorting domain-containing protein [Ignavibacteria bacterium]|nr:T9SS type A sorting domain-containing protein [Ignavibacteria bacterium]